MSDAERRMRGLHYAAAATAEVDPATYVNEGVFSTNAESGLGSDAGVTALAAHTHFFPGLAAEEDDAEENPNDVLLRLLNEVRAVDSDDSDDDVHGGVHAGLDGSAEDAAGAVSGSGLGCGGVVFSVTDSSGGKGFAMPYSGAVTATNNGGFTVEGNASYSSLASLPPPPPPPPAYGTPSTAPRSPFVNCYSGIPHLTATPGSTKPPPPTFAEAMSTSHGTPASLPGGGRPSISQERSPVMANYAPPMPAAAQEPVLLRNSNGVFLLQPSTKPTPPYTPPAGCNSPPVSPLPRYSLPPAAGLGGPNSSVTSNTFLGTSVAQVGTRTAANLAAEPPHYGPYGATASSSPFIATAVPFVSAMSSLRGTPSFAAAAPPPYTGGR